MANIIFVGPLLSQSTLSIYWVANNLLLDFSNVIRNNYLEELAEADEHEVVQQVQV